MCEGYVFILKDGKEEMFPESVDLITFEEDEINLVSIFGELPFRQMGGYNVAIQSAQNYRQLRKAGLTVGKTIDIIIATFCIIEGLTLLHDDREFDPIASHFSLKFFPLDSSASFC
jgi:hypothetical protein